MVPNCPRGAGGGILGGYEAGSGGNDVGNEKRTTVPSMMKRTASVLPSVGPGSGGFDPLCDIPSCCCSFTGPWTVPRSSLRMLRRVAAFCRPLRPVFLPVSLPRSRSPVVGVLGLCWMWRDVPFARQRRPVVGILGLCLLWRWSFDCFCFAPPPLVPCATGRRTAASAPCVPSSVTETPESQRPAFVFGHPPQTAWSSDEGSDAAMYPPALFAAVGHPCSHALPCPSIPVNFALRNGSGGFSTDRPRVLGSSSGPSVYAEEILKTRKRTSAREEVTRCPRAETPLVAHFCPRPPFETLPLLVCLREQDFPETSTNMLTHDILYAGGRLPTRASQPFITRNRISGCFFCTKTKKNLAGKPLALRCQASTCRCAPGRTGTLVQPTASSIELPP